MTNETKVKVVTADPSALGLFGLAIITLVASSQKLGLTSWCISSFTMGYILRRKCSINGINK